jgi:energy-coupling factor transporter ATP-binding protein EcfA2
MDLLPKQIVAWASGLPLWQRDLLRRVANGPLDESSRAEVAELVLGTQAMAAEPLSEADLPAPDGSDRPLSLLGIRDVHGVNALAEDQNLRFERQGLTIIYGNNGSGKSGYGRMLRRICQAPAGPEILPDAFGRDAGGQQSVRVKLHRGEQEEDLTIDLMGQVPGWLAAVKVFDGDCAIEYVRAGNAVDYTPEPLGVLSRCVDEQDAIRQVFRERADEITTPVTITAGTDIETLIVEATLTGEEVEELDRIGARLNALRRQDVDSVLAATWERSKATAELARNLGALDRELGEAIVSRIGKIRAEHVAASEALEELRVRALEGQPVSGTGTAPWRIMWEAARDFVADGFPPIEGEPCPMCQQTLDAESAARLKEFDAFLHSDLERRVAEHARSLSTILDNLPSPEQVHLDGTRQLATLDAPLRETVIQTLDALSVRRDALVANREASSVSIEPVISALLSRSESEAARARELDGLRLPVEQAMLRTRVQELDRRRQIIAEAGALREKHAYLRAAKQLETATLTHQHNKFAKLAITGPLIGAVKEELAAFGSFSDRIEVLVAGSKGRSVLRVRLKGSNQKPAQVLSEGEHRAVALALFLAEVRQRGGASVIIVEDPVSSLDHHWRDELAHRLAGEARIRQVIVFTHDLAFLALLSAEARYAGVSCAHRQLTRNRDRVGMVSDSLVLARTPFTERGSELRRRIDVHLKPLWEQNRDQYEIEVGTWISDLRKSWEMLVEEGLFQGVIRRYDPRIYVHRLKLLQIPDGATAKIVSAFHRLSGKAHHEPLSAGGTPPPQRLLELLEDFDDLVNELGSKQAETGVADNEAA